MARPDDQKCAKAACFERQQATASHAEAGRWVSSHAAERALARSSAHADEEAFAQRWDSTNQGLVASLPGSEIECVYRLGGWWLPTVWRAGARERVVSRTSRR